MLSYYRAAGAATHDLSHDQDTTDLHKAITAMVAEDAAAKNGDDAHTGKIKDSEDGDGVGDGDGRDGDRDDWDGDGSGGDGLGCGAGVYREIEGRWLRQHRIFVVGALGGRLDHEMSHMSAMHEFAETNIVLLGRTSLAMLVPPGTDGGRREAEAIHSLTRGALNEIH